MSRPDSSTPPSFLRRALAAALAAAIALLGCPSGSSRLAPAPGLPQYQERAAVPVPGGLVNPMGGNLLVRRVDLVVDTHLGPVEAGATYNSATGVWTWSFEIHYDGLQFLDPTGARHDAFAVADGAAIPGTTWVRLDASTLRTKGGLVHRFASGRLQTVHWASGAWPRLEVTHADVAGRARPVAVRQCLAPDDCTPVFDFSYDAAGEVAAVADRAGRVATFRHAGGRLVEARDALDHARGGPGFRYEYDLGGHMTAQVSSEGERVEIGYLDARVDVVRAVGPGDPTIAFAYEAQGQDGYATRVTDPLGHVFRYRYDGGRRLLALESEGTGEVWTTAWRGLRPERETEPDGATRRWVFADDDPVERIDPSGNVVRFAYAPHAEDREDPTRRPVAEIRDDLGLVERRLYDGHGRLVEVRNGEDETVLSLTWRSDGTVASRRTPRSEVAFGAYGVHGHPLSATVDGVTTPSRYDAVGNRLSGFAGAPELGGVVRRAYDEDRNVAAIVLQSQEGGALETVAIERRSDGRMLAVRRPAGGDHEFVYDALGRAVAVRERAEDAWHTTRVERDAAGRVTAVERPNGMRKETLHDALGRPVRLRWLRDGAVESSAELVWSAGRLVEVVDSTRGAPERHRYDAAGRRVETLFPDGERLHLEYDLRSRVVRETFEVGSFRRTLERGWDRADREIALLDEGQPVVTRSYASGRLARVDTGNGLSRTFSWDPAGGFPTGTRTTDATGALVEETVVGHEVVIGIVSGLRVVADTTTSSGVVATTHEEYWLAPASANGPDGEQVGRRVLFWSDGATRFRQYLFDGPSRRLASSEVDGPAFVWDPQRRRLLSASGPESGGRRVDYAYDEAGFVTERGGVPLTWTASGRLASWGAVQFDWDALERPLRSVVDGVERRFLFGGRMEADPSGFPLALDLGDVRIDLVDGSRLYRHRDFRDNVKFTTDDAGRVVSHYLYHPYGVERVYGAEDDGRRFVGGVDLGELVMLGARVLDPLTGRFLSPDPVFQLVNDFSYTLGNPVLFKDPDGRHFTVDLDVALAVAGFGTATIGLVGAAAAGPVILTVGAVGFAAAGLALALAAARHADHQKMHEFPRLSSKGGLGELSGGCSPSALITRPRMIGTPWALVLLLAWALVGGCSRRGRGRLPA